MRMCVPVGDAAMVARGVLRRCSEENATAFESDFALDVGIGTGKRVRCAKGSCEDDGFGIRDEVEHTDGHGVGQWDAISLASAKM